VRNASLMKGIHQISTGTFLMSTENSPVIRQIVFTTAYYERGKIGANLVGSNM
jgi:hypothetical protein